MPKGDFMTPKAISNRMKSVGLQKLRWYCQMCQKQCRDENGFKCHTSSEGHLRQMKLFADKSGSIIDQFSRDFEKGFLRTLSHGHGTKRVLANKIYQEYIADKNHVHMNSTRWTTLTGLCQYLGREGKCVVDETEKGWYIQYIDRDPKAVQRQLEREKRVQAELDDQDRINQMIEQQILAATVTTTTTMTDDEEDDDDENEIENEENYEQEGESGKKRKVRGAISLKIQEKKRKLPSNFITSNFMIEEDDDNDDNDDNDNSHRTENDRNDDQEDGHRSHDNNNNNSNNNDGVKDHYTSHHSHKTQSSSSSFSSSSSSSSSMNQQHHQHHINNTKDFFHEDQKDTPWLQIGLIVKIVNQTLEKGAFYKKKGVVVRIHHDYVGEIRLLGEKKEEDNIKIKVDQEQLETVLPQIGKEVIILRGKARGHKAILLHIHEDAYNCDIQITGDKTSKSSYANMILYGVEYEDICKFDASIISVK